jgi:hypothetical protein
MIHPWQAAAIGAMSIYSVPAIAQVQVNGGIETATDERRRGLSWSTGRPSASMDLSANLQGLSTSARVVALRRSPRHGGADAVVDLTVSTRKNIGLVDVELRGTSHLFAGARDRLDYVEVGATGSFTIGPLSLDAGLDFAPDQSAIGGTNLYLHGGATAGVPGTPITLIASIGRTSGGGTSERAARLRPDRVYYDWRVGFDYVRGRVTVGADYVGTDIERDRSRSGYADHAHVGHAVIVRARISF